MSSDGDGRSYKNVTGRWAPSSSQTLRWRKFPNGERAAAFYAFNLDDLIASAGPDYEVLPDILPGVVCRQCGGDLKFKLAMIPPEA